MALALARVIVQLRPGSCWNDTFSSLEDETLETGPGCVEAPVNGRDKQRSPRRTCRCFAVECFNTSRTRSRVSSSNDENVSSSTDQGGACTITPRERESHLVVLLSSRSHPLVCVEALRVPREAHALERLDVSAVCEAVADRWIGEVPHASVPRGKYGVAARAHTSRFAARAALCRPLPQGQRPTSGAEKKRASCLPPGAFRKSARVLPGPGMTTCRSSNPSAVPRENRLSRIFPNAIAPGGAFCVLDSAPRHRAVTRWRLARARKIRHAQQARLRQSASAPKLSTNQRSVPCAWLKRGPAAIIMPPKLVLPLKYSGAAIQGRRYTRGPSRNPGRDPGEDW